jgi:hypothetical protein
VFAGKVFALKRLKLENEKEGFPITSLREIDMLLKAKHPNIVGVRVSPHFRFPPVFIHLRGGLHLVPKLKG